MTRNTLVIAAVATQALFTLACYGGASLDSNDAGSDGWLDHTPPPAVEAAEYQNDGRCDWLGRPYLSLTHERAFALLNSDTNSDCNSEVWANEKIVYAMHRDAEPEALIDVTQLEDVRLLDTSAGLLLMAETDHERLWLLDHDTLEVLEFTTSPLRFWGTRTSPSRDWVMAADNEDGLKLHVIDPSDLSTIAVDDGAIWVEGQWMPHTDRLATIHFDQFTQARLELRDFTNGVPDEPIFQAQISGYTFNFAFNLTWVAASDDERFVAYPVREVESSSSVVLIVDLEEGTVSTIPDMDGPVRFAPDNTLIGWAPTLGEANAAIVLADPITLETTRVQVPFDVPEFVMSSGGDTLLVADVFGDGNLVIYDLDADESIVLPLAASLTVFTWREDTVWLVDYGQLHEIDLIGGVGQQVELPFTPRHVVWMPEADVMYVDDSQRPTAHFIDPITYQDLGSRTIVPGASQPRLDLSLRAVRDREPQTLPQIAEAE